MTECGDHLPFLHRLANAKAIGNFPEMRVEREHLHAVPTMFDHNVAAVVGEARLRVDERHFAVGDRVDGIGRLATPVALQTLDVHALVKPPAVRAHAAEHAGLDYALDCGLKELSFAPRSQ
jgi:hypothetical protein